MIGRVVDESEYLNAEYKIVFLLKEVNGGSGWNLRKFLSDGGRASTWNNAARWTKAILNLDTPHDWSYGAENNDERRLTYLKKIAAVSLQNSRRRCF